MTDIEKEKLEQLNDDVILLGILRKIFLDQLDTMPLLRESKEKISNEVLGQITRGNLDAYTIIEKGFKEIEKYKKVKIPERNNQNPAR